MTDVPPPPHFPPSPSLLRLSSCAVGIHLLTHARVYMGGIRGKRGRVEKGGGGGEALTKGKAKREKENGGGRTRWNKRIREEEEEAGKPFLIVLRGGDEGGAQTTRRKKESRESVASSFRMRLRYPALTGLDLPSKGSHLIGGCVFLLNSLRIPPDMCPHCATTSFCTLHGTVYVLHS